MAELPIWHWWMIALQKTLRAILDYQPPEAGPGPATSAKVKVLTQTLPKQEFPKPKQE